MNGLQIKWVAQAMANTDKLDDWEKGFIKTLFANGDDYELSKKENHKLNKIVSERLQD